MGRVSLTWRTVHVKKCVHWYSKSKFASEIRDDSPCLIAKFSVELVDF